MSYVSPGIPRTTFARRVFLWPHCSTACVVRVESCRTLAPDTETWPWPVRQGHTRVSSPSRGALRCRRTPSATSRLHSQPETTCDSYRQQVIARRDDTLPRHGTGSLDRRVNGSFGSSFTSGSPGHHFDPVWDPTPVFPVFEKSPR